MKSIIETMKQRYSVRSYSGKIVEPALIGKITDEAACGELGLNGAWKDVNPACSDATLKYVVSWVAG